VSVNLSWDPKFGFTGLIPSDTNPRSLEGIFAVGQLVKLRILKVDQATSRIIGSIVQAIKPSSAIEISKLEIGQTITGPVAVTDIHQDNVVLELRPKDSATKLKALISFANLANHRGTTVQRVRASLDVGQEIKEQLALVSKNVERALLIVAVKPQAKAKVPNGQTSTGGGSLRIGDVKVGMIVPGLVIRHHPKGSTVRISKHVFATLYLTDVCDNFETGNPFPALDSVISVTVLKVDESDQKVVVSARPSRIHPAQAIPVIDREISSLDDLTVGDEIRGFVKIVADHGVFVSIGRGTDARIQIKELFDEVSYSLRRLGLVFILPPVRERLEATLPGPASRQGSNSQVSLSSHIAFKLSHPECPVSTLRKAKWK
jgi:rRNA biogenesis protein RRP5